jgi:hypothetical protein
MARLRSEPREYRKTTTVLAGVAPTGGVIATLEGDHTYEAGDYICGPGAAGEYWPVRRDIFEATYALIPEGAVLVTEAEVVAALEVARVAVGVCNDWMGDPDHGFVLDALALPVDAFILASVGSAQTEPVSAGYLPTDALSHLRDTPS